MKKLGRNVLMLMGPAICGFAGGNLVGLLVYFILIVIGCKICTADKNNNNRFATYLWLACITAYLYGALLSGACAVFGLDLSFKIALYVVSFIAITVLLIKTHTKGVPFINFPVFFVKWICKRNEEYLKTL